MAKLINILAASVGGGLLLGASIRLGEAIGSKLNSLPEPDGDGSLKTPVVDLNGRLERLERRLSGSSAEGSAATAPEWQRAVASVAARIDRQQREVETIADRLSRSVQAMESTSGKAAGLREELRRELGDDLDRRLAAIETRLQLNMEAANRKTVDTMLSSIETRIAARISRMESDIAGQSVAVGELRDCALQSERSVQRLIGVLERFVNPATGSAGDIPRAEEPRLSVVPGR
jgi:uncharacterized coiled-coil protein SlyX